MSASTVDPDSFEDATSCFDGSSYLECNNIFDNDFYSEQVNALTKADCDTAGGIWHQGDILSPKKVCSFSHLNKPQFDLK